jgi:hypothetical protein
MSLEGRTDTYSGIKIIDENRTISSLLKNKI